MVVLARLVHVVFAVFAAGLIAHVVLSWVDSARLQPAQRQLGRIYRPFLSPIRGVFPAVRAGNTQIDLSPMILLTAVLVVRQLLMFILLGT